MPARLLSTDLLAASIREEAGRQAAELRALGRIPSVRAVLIGHSVAAARLAAERERLCREAGVDFAVVAIPGDVAESDADGRMSDLARDPSVTGITLLPELPDAFDRARLLRRIPPEKDIDGLHPANRGRALENPECALTPPLASAVHAALVTHEIELYDRTACLVGDLRVFGLPLAALLATRHPRLCLLPPDPGALLPWTAASDVLVVAAGERRMIRPEMIRPGAVLLDAGSAGPGAGGEPDSTGAGFFDPGVLEIADALLPAGALLPLVDALFLQNAVETARLRAPGKGDGALSSPPPPSTRRWK